MDWHMMWAIAVTTPGEIVMLILFIAVCATLFVYLFCDTGLIGTLAAFAALSASGLFGHAYFSMNDIFFSYETGHTAIIGATLSMTACFVLYVFVVRIVSDAVYNNHYVPPQEKPDQFRMRRRF
ncbi:MAG: hypothetical protein AAFR90_02400 [Pseudomonadota bacterium]